jgi:hypothetical protein
LSRLRSFTRSRESSKERMICGDPSRIWQEVIRVTVEPGICGFTTIIEAKRTGRYTVSVKVYGTECKHVMHVAGSEQEIRLKELFAPVTANLIFLAAQQAGCHPSCPVPVAVLKAAEVAMDMALPRDVRVTFEVKGEGIS